MRKKSINLDVLLSSSTIIIIMVSSIYELIACSAVFDEGIDAIPAAGAPLDKFLSCDVCMRKDEKLKLAQIYCVICQKKFCKPHMDVS